MEVEDSFKMMSQMAVSEPYEMEVERIESQVKWFNPEKGYGFLSPDDGSADIFMHFSVLEAAGHRRVDSGDVLVCEIGPGKRGRQVLRILEVKLMPRDMRQMAPVYQMARAPHADPDALEEVYGEIKWFNPLRGYGFICPDDGGREIFVHASVLRDLGYETLEPGIRVHAKVSSSSRGREARIIEIIR